jgi:plastocyanin
MGRRLTVGMLVVAAMMGGPASSPSADVPEPVVNVRLFQFHPQVLTVATATRVVWTNDDDILHTVTTLPGVSGARGFSRRLQGKGASTTVTFTEPGMYPYACERHPHMRGEVRVENREPDARTKGDRS